MYKSFSWKLQASDSQTATSTEMSMNQTENKMYQQTDGFQIFQQSREGNEQTKVTREK